MFASINFIQTELQAIQQNKENYGYNYKIVTITQTSIIIEININCAFGATISFINSRRLHYK
jgi:hypothetical protein